MKTFLHIFSHYMAGVAMFAGGFALGAYVVRMLELELEQHDHAYPDADDSDVAVEHEEDM